MCHPYSTDFLFFLFSKRPPIKSDRVQWSLGLNNNYNISCHLLDKDVRKWAEEEEEEEEGEEHQKQQLQQQQQQQQQQRKNKNKTDLIYFHSRIFTIALADK